MYTDAALMSPDLDEAAYLRYALHTTHTQSEQSRLLNCSNTLQGEILKILSQHVEELLQHVTAACQAQREITNIHQATSTLLQSSNRLRQTIQEPHRVIQGNITKLQNTNAVLGVLRNILKFLTLTTRLKSLLPNDLARAAKTLKEVEELLQTSNITGIEVVDACMETVEKAAVIIRTKAQEMMRKGGDMKDTSGVAISLQCFFTLGSLPRILSSLMTEQKREVMKSLMKDLDLQSISDEINYGNNNNNNNNNNTVVDINSQIREILFSRIKSAFTNTVQHTQIIVAVWRVLIKKVDPITHISYLSIIENPTSILGDYWHLITDKLRERLQMILKRPNFLVALSSDILHYRTLLNEFLNDMKELLELLDRLIEMDTSIIKRTGTSTSSSSSLLLSSNNNNNNNNNNNKNNNKSFPGSIGHLKRVWLSQVTQEVNERFTGHIMDRHREKLHHIISKLPSITPNSSNKNNNINNNNSNNNIVVDLQRPQVPSAVQVLETRGYTILASQDIMMYRQDPYILSIILDCMFQSLNIFLQPIIESINKYPLPPLPSVSGDVSTLQMLHICISNACTILSNDLAALLASIPEEEIFTIDRVNSRWNSGLIKTRNQNENDNDITEGEEEEEEEKIENSDVYISNTKKSVMEKHRQLYEFANKVKLISEQTLKPFFKSASVLLLDSISICVNNNTSQTKESAGIGRLQSQIKHFMSHFYYLFEPQTPTLDDNTRKLTDSLLARLIVIVTLIYPFSRHLQNHILNCLQEIAPVIFASGPVSSYGNIGRSTMSLKGQLHQLHVWYGLSEESFNNNNNNNNNNNKSLEEWQSVLITLPPIISRLLLLQRVLQSSSLLSTIKKPHTIMGVTSESFIEIVETAVLEQFTNSPTTTRSFMNEVINNNNNNNNTASLIIKIGEAINAVTICFREAVKSSQGVEVVQYMEKLWEII